MSDIIYTYKNNVYFNITNYCTCKCIFCIRDEKDTLGDASSLWHHHAPSFEEIQMAIDHFDFTDYSEATFCGYGEPTCVYSVLLKTAAYMKSSHPHIRLRLNTNGLGERYNQKPIVEELSLYIDAVSISLNAPSSDRYQEITTPPYPNAFTEMLNFAEKSKTFFSSVQFSVVNILSQPEIAASQILADKMNIPLKIREYS